MTNEKVTNNYVELCGVIDSEFRFNHEVFGEKFYLVDIKIKRLSEIYDIIPCLISERLINTSKNMIGTQVKIDGQFRSFNKHISENKSKLLLSVFVRDIEIGCESRLTNEIELIGYIVKQPVFRKTPLGKEICDLILAVNRPYGKTDYIPCIVWGRNARFSRTLNIGDKVKLAGRIQSRNYQRKLSETEIDPVIRTAYEVSGYMIHHFNEDNECID